MKIKNKLTRGEDEQRRSVERRLAHAYEIANNPIVNHSATRQGGEIALHIKDTIAAGDDHHRASRPTTQII
jgi:hypothetical protein